MRKRFEDFYHEGLSKYYSRACYLDSGVGNNAFSLERKPERERLMLTRLEIGLIGDLQCSSETSFQDYDSDVWMQCGGLEKAILSFEADMPIYVFDNHNHAFYGWIEALHAGVFSRGARLVHMDAHFDDAEPEHVKVDLNDIEDVWKYTNETLQIASFIKPALELDVFDQVVNYVESADFTELPEIGADQEIILDIDLDVFCDEMSHVSWKQKLDVITHYLPQTKLITMATSPFFIDQQRAIDIAKRLMDELFLSAD